MIIAAMLFGLCLMPMAYAGLLMTAGTERLYTTIGETSNIAKVGYATSNMGNISFSQTLKLYATGEGAKYLNFPDSVDVYGKNCTDYNIKYRKTFCNGDLSFITLSTKIPSDYTGNKTMTANLYALSYGKCGSGGMSVCINIQMKKSVIIQVTD
jgi:hypothetical protein